MFGHPPCLLLNPCAPLFLAIPASGGGLTASYLQVYPLTSFTGGRAPVDPSSSGISYYRLQLPPLTISVEASR